MLQIYQNVIHFHEISFFISADNTVIFFVKDNLGTCLHLTLEWMNNSFIGITFLQNIAKALKLQRWISV